MELNMDDIQCDLEMLILQTVIVWRDNNGLCLHHPLAGELHQHIVQVVGVWVAVARVVWHALGLVVDLIPYHSVGGSSGDRGANRESQTPLPCNSQQLKDLHTECWACTGNTHQRSTVDIITLSDTQLKYLPSFGAVW